MHRALVLAHALALYQHDGEVIPNNGTRCSSLGTCSAVDLHVSISEDPICTTSYGRVLQAFLNAQHVVLPLVCASAVASLAVHPILLHYLIPSLGPRGSAFCIAMTMLCMVLFVF